MTPELERLAEDIFAAASELPPGERTAFVNARCTHAPPAVHGHVRVLLAAFDQAGDTFLDPAEIRRLTMVGQMEQGAHAEEQTLPHGTRVGEYTIERVLGAGGMGVVYVARQEKPRRTVALKIIRRGLGTSGLLRRFEHEAEVLARLQHPGIAQVYAAGSADVAGAPQPFIAMELVRGRPLTQYADENKLDSRRRLDLVAKSCDAVHHAHQRAVIHRDLKPANILVDEQGQPKVLDFGVARAADADVRMTTMRTSVGQLIGTLPYMSPEQVAGDPAEVDTRTDVYAMGVVLYQLLTGRLPHDVSSRSLPEAARVIRDEAPPKLSHVSRVFRGEIDTIVSKALEKDKTRRYQSAAELAEDIRRHLSGQPILATRDRLYLLGKQIARYRWAVGGALAAAIGLAAFAGYASWQAQVNRALARSEGEAKVRADESLALADRRAAELEQALYQSRIGFAQAAVASGDLLRAADQLDQCRPPDRGWEWHHIRYRCDQSTSQVKLAWEPRYGAASADSLVLYGADDHGVLRATDAATGEVIRRFESDAKYTQVALSPDERRIACIVAQAGIDVFDTATGQRVLRIDAPQVQSPFPGLYHLAWADQGKSILATALRSQAFVFDAATGALQRRWKVADTDVFDLAAADEGRAAATTASDGHIRVWDTRTGDLIASRPISGQAVKARFSPDGSMLAVGLHQARVLLWSWRTDEPPRELQGLEGAPYEMTFSRDGASLVSSQRLPTLICWNTASGEMRWRRRVPTSPIVLFPTTQGEGVVTLGRDSVMRTWHLNPRPPAPAVGVSGAIIGQAPMPGEAGVFLFGRDGSIFAVDRFSLAATPAPATVPPETRWVMPAADGRVCGVTDLGTAWTWDGRSAAIEPFEAFPRGNARAAVSPDGRTLAIQDLRAGITLVNLSTHERTSFETGIDLQGGVAWTPDGRLLVGHARTHIGTWTTRGEPVGPRFEFVGVVQRFAMSPDGRLLVASTSDGEMLFWNARDGSRRRAPVSVGADAMAITFLPDGSRFITAHTDRMVRVWDAERCEELASLLGHAAVPLDVTIFADGPTIATADNQGTVRFWEVGPPAPPHPPTSR
ncbi:eukaryotic-like serine/threonine-protein kinase [Phycisphaerales bacterium]|nr:eukaryotic-like serine/threonine-protein kinase [Phycisphaerales bacterium]